MCWIESNRIKIYSYRKIESNRNILSSEPECSSEWTVCKINMWPLYCGKRRSTLNLLPVLCHFLSLPRGEIFTPVICCGMASGQSTTVYCGSNLSRRSADCGRDGIKSAEICRFAWNVDYNKQVLNSWMSLKIGYRMSQSLLGMPAVTVKNSPWVQRERDIGLSRVMRHTVRPLAQSILGPSCRKQGYLKSFNTSIMAL